MNGISLTNEDVYISGSSAGKTRFNNPSLGPLFKDLRKMSADKFQGQVPMPCLHCLNSNGKECPVCFGGRALRL